MGEQAVAKEADQDPKPKTGPETDPKAATQSSGVAELQALIAKGPPDLKKVVALIDAHRGEHDAMFALLHQSLGNAFVDQVTQEMAKLRASIDRKEVVAGDPNNPNGGFFEASAAAEGAKWSTKGGGFTGTADKNGLDTHTKVDAHDEIHAKVGADKSATVDWNKDGKTEAEAFGKFGGKDDWNAGVKRDWDLGNKSTLDTKYQHTAAKDGSTDALSADYKSGDGKTTASGEAGIKNGKFIGDAKGSHAFADGTTVSGELGTTDGKVTEKVDASADLGKNDKATAKLEHAPDKTSLDLSETHQFGKGKLVTTGGLVTDKTGTSEKLGADYTTTDGKDEIAATLAHDPKSTSVGLSETHKFGGGGTLTSKVDASQTDKGFSGSWSEAYKDKTTSIDGSIAKNPDGTKLHLGGTEQVNPNLSLGGNLDYSDPTAAGKKSETSFDLSEKYKSNKMVQSLSLGGGTGERDYLNMKGGIDAQLAPKLYGGAWGGATVEAGKQTSAQLGASLTFTPNEKTALTLAGVIDQHGSLETRLQFDVFKSKVESVGDLADHKKDAMVSLFLSYKQSTGAGQLDDRYGGANFSTPLGGGGGTGGSGSQVMAGLKINF